MYSIVVLGIFFVEATQYLLDWCPLDDVLLDHVGWINFNQKLDFTFTSVEYFVSTFSYILGDIDHDELAEEFIGYQLLCQNDIPESVKELCQLSSSDDHISCIDSLYLRLLKTPDTTTLRFNLLFRVAETVLTIPHSNAGEERIFSYVTKNKTPSRSSLQLDGTLSSILTTKTDPLNWKPTTEIIEKAKKATREYNTEHSK